MLMKPLAIAFSALLGLCSGAAQAALIVPAYATTYDGVTNLNNVTLTLASTVPFPTSPSTISVEDVRGTAAITDTGTSSFDVLYSGAAPLPNSLLLGLNSTFSQEVLLSFDLAAPDLAFGAPFYTGDVVAAATGIAVGTVTDPSLTPFIGTTLFEFTYEANDSNPANGVLTYGLSAISPSTAALRGHDAAYNRRAVDAMFKRAFNMSHVKDMLRTKDGQVYRVDVAQMFAVARPTLIKVIFLWSLTRPRATRSKEQKV